ncbi:poxvirus early transcription factor (VETF) large subunit [Faustovirus]|nr:poxvirus early transcription factor (VETF) large subunit [Faustovirus]
MSGEILNGSLNTESRKDIHPISHEYHNLVFEGGGVLGVSYCGALEELHKLNILKNITGFAGTSVGSIVAALLACGASYNFIKSELMGLDLAKLTDYTNDYKIVNFINLINQFGLCKGDKLYNWITDMLYRLTGREKITFGDIKRLYGTDLYITGTNLNHRNVVYFHHTTHPDMQIRDAIRISTSVPGIFTPVVYNGELMVDGGVVVNLPINAFIKKGEHSTSNTLAFMFIHSIDSANKPAAPITGVIEYFWAVAETALNTNYKQYMHPDDYARTLKIDVGNISSMNFNITSEQREFLVEQGRSTVRTYFKHLYPIID